MDRAMKGEMGMDMGRGSCVDCEEQDAYYIDSYGDEVCSTCYDKRIKGDIMLAVGNGEKCPWCDTILDNRDDHEGENITKHMFDNHKEEMLNKLF